MKTAREIASEGEGCDSWPHEWHCDDATRAARAAQLDALRWARTLVIEEASSMADMIIEKKIAELEAGPASCKRCGGPKRDSQVYCGAACSVLAEAGK